MRGCCSMICASMRAAARSRTSSSTPLPIGDIFFNNCLKNSVVPVVLDGEICADMRAQLRARSGAEITVDLERQVVIDVSGHEHAFRIHPLRRRCLLEGLDDISLTTELADVMRPFEAAYRREFPWLCDAQ